MGVEVLFSKSDSDLIEDTISTYRLDQDNLIKPAFGNGSIADIPGFLKQSLGLPGRRPLPDFLKNSMEEVDHMVFFLLDGFGHTTLEHLLKHYKAHNTEKFLEGSAYFPLTSVFPSTTSTATVTYHTDLEPLEHGIIGYISYIAELGSMCNMINLTPLGRSDYSLLEHGWRVPVIEEKGTIYQEFGKNVVDPFLYMPSAIKGSGMSEITSTGSNLRGYTSVSQMMTDLRRNIEKSVRRSIHFCYLPSVDTISHKVGPYTEETAMEIESIFHHLRKQFLEKVVPDGTLGISISADHGHTVLPHENISDVRQDRNLAEMLRAPVAGDFRAPILKIREGGIEPAMDHLEKHYGEKFVIKRGKQAISEGFFGSGKVDRINYDRFGDLILFPRQNVGLMDSSLGILDSKLNNIDLIGMHGGLSEEEMIVPFITKTVSRK